MQIVALCVFVASLLVVWLLYRVEKHWRAKKGKPPMTPYVTVSAILAALIFISGFFHFVHGPGGPAICFKRKTWALSDTVVDSSDYVGKPLITMLAKADVLVGLIRCEVLEPPDFGE